MGFLNLFSSPKNSRLARLPAGSFTLDGEGRVMTSTLPQSFSSTQMREIGRKVLAAFQAARKAEIPLSEIVVQYTALKLQARKLRHGAIVFLAPQTLTSPRKTQPVAPR
jgi:hypothetical protein